MQNKLHGTQFGKFLASGISATKKRNEDEKSSLCYKYYNSTALKASNLNSIVCFKGKWFYYMNAKHWRVLHLFYMKNKVLALSLMLFKVWNYSWRCCNMPAKFADFCWSISVTNETFDVLSEMLDLQIGYTSVFWEYWELSADDGLSKGPGFCNTSTKRSQFLKFNFINQLSVLI